MEYHVVLLYSGRIRKPAPPQLLVPDRHRVFATGSTFRCLFYRSGTQTRQLQCQGPHFQAPVYFSDKWMQYLV